MALPGERISLLKVPIDILECNDVEGAVFELLKNGGGENIVLLSLWDLLRARHNIEYRDYIKSAALVIPISKSLVRGARFLTGKIPERYMPFNFIIRLLTILEKRELTVYLLGGSKSSLAKSEKHIRETFPKLRVVGRFPGCFKKHNEDSLLQVIRKSAPSLLLVNEGVPGGERWIARNNSKLNAGLRLWCSDIFDIFAKQKKRPSKMIFDNGLEWIGFCFQKPLRFFRLFRYFYYNILLVLYKLRKNNGVR
ncbi:MAG: WecB/TagA/CpsF family glycosyltransferase [Spirochaetaceae bacterium]|nr:WecB/TagA/CpsF family glycosyltransferase [Spirochaetaceae bacterium]